MAFPASICACNFFASPPSNPLMDFFGSAIGPRAAFFMISNALSIRASTASPSHSAPSISRLRIRAEILHSYFSHCRSISSAESNSYIYQTTPLPRLRLYHHDFADTGVGANLFRHFLRQLTVTLYNGISRLALVLTEQAHVGDIDTSVT